MLANPQMKLIFKQLLQPTSTAERNNLCQLSKRFFTLRPLQNAIITIHG